MAMVICALSVVLMVVSVVAMIVVQTWSARTPIGYDDRAITVVVGDVWQFTGETSAKLLQVNCEVYVVEGPNVGTEAGPDSWVMIPADPKTFEPLGIKRRAYMHRPARVVKGEWKCLRRCGALTRGGERWLQKQAYS